MRLISPSVICNMLLGGNLSDQDFAPEVTGIWYNIASEKRDKRICADFRHRTPGDDDDTACLSGVHLLLAARREAPQDACTVELNSLFKGEINYVREGV